MHATISPQQQEVANPPPDEKPVEPTTPAKPAEQPEQPEQPAKPNPHMRCAP